MYPGSWTQAVTIFTLVSLLGCVVMVGIIVIRDIMHDEAVNKISRQVQTGMQKVLIPEHMSKHEGRSSFGTRDGSLNIQLSSSSRVVWAMEKFLAPRKGRKGVDPLVQEVLDETLELHQTIDVWSVKQWLETLHVSANHIITITPRN
jgi:hypothetical protein